jgi:2-polyprenyl-3-methyl-5-hydroxy-6-metoxy-1,4-benzoquinol methylase
MNVAERIYFFVTRSLGKLTGKYYFEDYVRVYPDGIVINRLGRRKRSTENERNNYLNHRKFYEFAAQFVRGKTVADIGCGSGYGCDILKRSGAASVFGCDISRSAIAFAEKRFPGAAEFSVQGITSLDAYRSGSFDVTVSSEVLEHIKEYGKEDEAVRELKRISAPGGVVVLGTPNLEMTDDHGFSFDEIDSLLARHFRDYVIFENAIVPAGARKRLWAERQREGRVGTVITQAIAFEEAYLPGAVAVEVKQGSSAGSWTLGSTVVDTSLLHNTHSWVVVALVDE